MVRFFAHLEPKNYGTPGENTVESQYHADFWRKRAENARAIAQTMKSLPARQEMEAIAAVYDRLAEQAERTGARPRQRS